MEREQTLNNERMERPGTETSRLRLLSRMDDFKVASDSTDVRGWDVVSRDGRDIGTIDHLVVDPAASEVRYLGVDLKDGLAERGRGDHVLVPIEGARLGHQGEVDKVFLNRSSREIGAFPVYDEGSIGKLLNRLSGSETDLRSPGRGGTLVIEEILIPLSREREGERSH